MDVQFLRAVSSPFNPSPPSLCTRNTLHVSPWGTGILPFPKQPLRVLTPSSRLLTQASFTVAVFLIAWLTVALPHGHQPLTVGAAMHAGCP